MVLKKALKGQLAEGYNLSKDTVPGKQRDADIKLTLNTTSYRLCFFIISAFGSKYLD